MYRRPRATAVTTPRATPAVAAFVISLVAAAFWAGYLVARPATPGNSSVEAGFARDMTAHHEQAVEMAEAIRTHTADPRLLTLATDIALTQQAQIGRMRGWLDSWGLRPSATAPPMTWAGHGDGGMLGMATRGEINRLTTLDVAAAEAEFLQLMVAHHRGGVSMARAALDLAAAPEVRSLAASIVRSQTAEIDLLEQLLRERGVEAPPERQEPTTHATREESGFRPVDALPFVVTIAAGAWVAVSVPRWRRHEPADPLSLGAHGAGHIS